jgi:Fe-S-cluster containining protein
LIKGEIFIVRKSTLTRNNLEINAEPLNNRGSIEACKKCSGLVCCGVVEEGGIIEPPHLIKYDIANIEYFTGLKRNQFCMKRKNPITGNYVYIMRTVKDEGCIFFNGNNGKCQIYNYRPIDCRIFPLDCRDFSTQKDIKADYYWSLYKLKRCRLSKKDISVLLEFKNEAIKFLQEELQDFATYPLPEMDKVGFKKLMKVEFPKHL